MKKTISIGPVNDFLYILLCFFKWACHLPKSLVFKVVTIEGISQEDTSNFVLCYCGNGDNLGYLKNLSFSEIQKESISSLPIWRLRSKIKEIGKADNLLFVETNRLLNFLLPSGAFRTFPWISQKVFLNLNGQAGKRHNIENFSKRKIRQNKYTFQVSSERETVTEFYDKFYVPYIKSRFKNATHLRKKSEFLSAVKSGFLIQVLSGDGSWVAGAICKIKRKELIVLSFGLCPEYNYHLQRGAMSAVYYFIFEWAKKNSKEVVNLLRSRPNLQDGVFKHKHRWGAVAEMDMWPHTSIWIFVPQKSEIPEIYKKQLVLRENKFIELERLLDPLGIIKYQAGQHKTMSLV